MIYTLIKHLLYALIEAGNTENVNILDPVIQ